MLAIHDQFSHQMRSRLKTTGIALGLVRLLQDAKRFDEARATLHMLEEGFQGAAIEIQSDPAICQPPNTYYATVVAASEANALVLATSGSSA